MIKILKRSEVKNIEVVTFSNNRDSFIGTLEQILYIPCIFFKGSRWIMEHNCPNCKTNFRIDSSSDLIRLGDLSYHDLNNKSFLKTLGELFDLTLKDEVDVNNFVIFNYYLTEKIKGLARIAYYRCSNCFAQYLMAYMNLWGEGERNPTPDEVYIEKILQVSFDHDLFMKTLEEARVKL